MCEALECYVILVLSYKFCSTDVHDLTKIDRLY